MSFKPEELIPIKGLGYDVFPRPLLGKDLFESQLYLQGNGLDALPSSAICKLAKRVEPAEPSDQFLDYAAKNNTDMSRNEAASFYKELHGGIWGKYWIRAKEFLVWIDTTPSPFSHPRISFKPAVSELESFLIRDYKIVDKGNKDYVFETALDSLVQVNWLKEDGEITAEMAKLLGAPNSTSVRADSYSTVHEGLRALDWNFWHRVNPGLDSSWSPWGRSSGLGSLPGRKLEKKEQ
jgi:hypothetical protein